MRVLVAEALGTFCLVFAGTGAIIVNQATGGAVTHPGIALTFGLVVMAMICAFGRVSGAHLNPAVSVAFVLTSRFPIRQLPPYVAAQFIGALCASMLLRAISSGSTTLGETVPSGPLLQSFVLEVVLTFMLVFVVLGVAHGSEDRGPVAAIAIGATVGLEAMFAGPISGASMNPARSLAPALVSGNLEAAWVYLAAPVLGACLAVLASPVVVVRNDNQLHAPGPSPVPRNG